MNRPCFNCGGEGKVEIQGPVNSASSEPNYQDVTCPTCEGEGSLETL